MDSSEKPTLRAKPPGATAKSFSIRLTEDERRHLADRAGRQPLATYLRSLVLAETARARRRPSIAAINDHEALARVLAALGQSRIASSLRELAKASTIGALPVSPEAEDDIRHVCAAVAAMRADLMQALGVHEGGRS